MTTVWITPNQKLTEQFAPFYAVNSSGYLENYPEVGWRIVDPSGSQIAPSSAGTYHDVTSNAGRFDVGSYRAYDGSNLYVIPSNPTDGIHYIEWRYKRTNSSEYEYFTQYIDVLTGTGLTSPGWTYISPRRIRDEGISVTALTNARLYVLLLMAQEYVEQFTGQFFRPIKFDLRMDAVHSEAVFLPVPIIGIKDIKVNGSTSVVSKASIGVAFEDVFQSAKYTPPNDRRRNPMIRFRSDVSIFSGIGRAMRQDPRFMTGIKAQSINGVFGFVETNLTTPSLVEFAMMKLIIANTPKLKATTTVTTTAGPIKSETVDRHSVTYAQTASSTGQKSSLATSKEVEEILVMYKRPIGLSTTAPTFPFPFDRTGG